MMTLKAILWDVDGTLVDSEKLHYACLQQHCVNTNIPFVLTEAETLGVSLSDIWHIAKIHAYVKDKQAWVNTINRMYIDKISSRILRKGIASLIQFIHLNGYPQACVSNGEADVVKANLQKTGLSPYMKFWLTRDDVIHPKPHPEIYLNACQLLGLTSHEVIAVEDSLTGIKSAKSAGIFTVAIVDNKEKMKEHSLADAKVMTAEEIKKIIISRLQSG
jgi:HAD superfamily hydrolase (TIGR01509 family)